MIKVVQEAHAKNTEQLRNEAEEKKRLERLGKEQLEEDKKIFLELEQPLQKKHILDKKEDELRSDEVKFEKQYYYEGC